MPLKIAIVVHGRFHAFDLARELIKQGVEVTLLTNYPKRIATRFGIPPECVINCVSHGVASRIVHRLGLAKRFEPWLHRWFSWWATRSLKSVNVDALHSFSGVCEELFKASSSPGLIKSVIRGSAHIRTQARLLAEEQARCGHRLDQPSAWMVQREIMEYELADLVFVLSTFAMNSFIQEGFPAEKLCLLLLGSELRRFRSDLAQVEQRCQRILSGKPLQVLMVGSFSLQKGAFDFTEIVERLNGRVKFRFVGDLPAETRHLRNQIKGNAEFLARQPQFFLPEQYARADLFLFTTIQDGYAVVLAQAQASGLPILSTTNCAAPDLVRENETGWVLPIRNPTAFVERLEWCDQNRAELARISRQTYDIFKARDWADVASDMVRIYEKRIQKHPIG